MYILSTKKLRFDKERDMVFSEKEEDNSFTTQGGRVLEEAPDWIADTDFYKLAIDDGSVVDTTTEKARRKADADPTVTAVPVPVVTADTPKVK